MRKKVSRMWKVGLILISWMAILGFDFLLHAGLLAKMEFDLE